MVNLTTCLDVYFAPDSTVANDGHDFFGVLNGLIATGPMLDNINDFRAIVIESGRACEELRLSFKLSSTSSRTCYYLRLRSIHLWRKGFRCVHYV